MQFDSDEDLEILYERLFKYNVDEEYKEEIQKNYLNNPFELEFLDIYLLEEVYKFGKSSIFKNLMKLHKLDNPITSISQLENLYNNNFNILQSLYVKNKSLIKSK